ncbi:MAG TPA: RidA family protein [Alphaproteobacteria bacterium]|nr:RidA family protein [Alphaproteobacteria bacterium]
MIHRLPGSAPGRSRVVVHGGLVFTVATAREKSASMRAQAASALAVLDAHLAEAGTDKSKLLSATVYIADMARKPEMNEVWIAWVDPANPPQRACIGAALEGDDLIEIVAIAAL